MRVTFPELVERRSVALHRQIWRDSYGVILSTIAPYLATLPESVSDSLDDDLAEYIDRGSVVIEQLGLPGLLGSTVTGRPTVAIMQEQFDRLRVALGKVVSQETIVSRLQANGETIARTNLRQLRRVLSIDVRQSSAVSAEIDRYIRESTGRISLRVIGASDDRDSVLGRVSDLILRSFDGGITTDDMRKSLLSEFGLGRYQAERIARTEIAHIHSAVNRANQTNAGVQFYTWQTARDSRVRKDHQDRQGLRYSWFESPPDGHPGEPIQCRCTASPVAPWDV